MEIEASDIPAVRFLQNNGVVDCVRMETSNPRYNNGVSVLSSFDFNVRTHPTGLGPVVFNITNWHNWSPEGETKKKNSNLKK